MAQKVGIRWTVTDGARDGQRELAHLKPWAGTLDQLMRAARLCAKRVVGAEPCPDDEPEKSQAWYDARARAKRARTVEIVVVEDGGFVRTLTAIDDLAELPSEDLDRIGVIAVEVGGNGHTPSSAKINVSRRDGLEVRICGHDRTWTAGLRHEVQDILRPRARLRPFWITSVEVVAGAVAILFVPVWLGPFYLLRHAARWPRGTSVGVSLAVATLIAGFVIFLVVWLPTMEIFAPGAKPKYQRWKSKIVAAAAALGLGVIAAIIAAALPHG